MKFNMFEPKMRCDSRRGVDLFSGKKTSEDYTVNELVEHKIGKCEISGSATITYNSVLASDII